MKNLQYAIGNRQYGPRHSTQMGFTLIEMVVATAVVGIIIVLTLSFLTDTLVNSFHKSARAEMLGDAQIALDVVNRDIKHAANVDDNNRWPDDNSPGAPGNLLSWQSDGDTLILASPVVDENNDFLYLDPFTYTTHKNNLIYFVDNGRLYRRTLAATVTGNEARTSCPPDTGGGCPDDSTLAENVVGFSVAYLDSENNPVAPTSARSVQLTLSLQKEVYGRDVSVSYQTLSVFRNE